MTKFFIQLWNKIKTIIGYPKKDSPENNPIVNDVNDVNASSSNYNAAGAVTQDNDNTLSFLNRLKNKFFDLFFNLFKKPGNQPTNGQLPEMEHPKNINLFSTTVQEPFTAFDTPFNLVNPSASFLALGNAIPTDLRYVYNRDVCFAVEYQMSPHDLCSFMLAKHKNVLKSPQDIELLLAYVKQLLYFIDKTDPFVDPLSHLIPTSIKFDPYAQLLTDEPKYTGLFQKYVHYCTSKNMHPVDITCLCRMHIDFGEANPEIIHNYVLSYLHHIGYTNFNPHYGILLEKCIMTKAELAMEVQRVLRMGYTHEQTFEYIHNLPYCGEYIPVAHYNGFIASCAKNLEVFPTPTLFNHNFENKATFPQLLPPPASAFSKEFIMSPKQTSTGKQLTLEDSPSNSGQSQKIINPSMTDMSSAGVKVSSHVRPTVQHDLVIIDFNTMLRDRITNGLIDLAQLIGPWVMPTVLFFYYVILFICARAWWRSFSGEMFRIAFRVNYWNFRDKLKTIFYGEAGKTMKKKVK